MSEVITFLAAAAVILVGALGVVLARNPVHSALFLIQTLLGVAVVFIVQDAHFLAAVQVVVYAGAIVILFLFVIMLLGVDRAEDMGVDPVAGQKPLAAVVGAALLAGALTMVLIATDGATGQRQVESPTDAMFEQRLDNGLTDIERIGRVLFTDGLVAFQLTAALLTIAVLGAVVLTRSVRSSDLLADREPATFDLPAAAPDGANDEHHAASEGQTEGDEQ